MPANDKRKYLTLFQLRYKDLQFSVATRAKFHWESPIRNWKKLGKHWRFWRLISNTIQSVKKPQPTGLENTAIPRFDIRITEIPQENLFKLYHNTANPNVPLSLE